MNKVKLKGTALKFRKKLKLALKLKSKNKNEQEIHFKAIDPK